MIELIQRHWIGNGENCNVQTTTTSTTTRPVSYTTGLINYWPFSASAVDVVGGMNLTIQLNGNYVADRLGNNNSALYLKNGYATAPPGVYFDCAVGFTVMTWIKLIESRYNARILEFSNGIFRNTVIVFLSGLTLESTTSNRDFMNWNPFAASNTALILGVWSHVAITINSSATNVYINGLQTASASGGTCESGIMRTSCKIGRSDWYPVDPDLNAVLDEFKIFNRVLSSAEIFNEMIFPFKYTKGLTNYWPFSGSTVDIVGSRNLIIQRNGIFQADRFNNDKSAIYFNLGYATAPPGIYFDCATGFTVMSWIKLISIGTFSRIIEFSNGLKNDTVVFFLGSANPCITTANNQNNGWGSYTTSNIPLELGVWTHVATTVDQIASIIYINGIQVGTGPGQTCLAKLRSSCKIGRSDHYPQQTDLNAYLDELKIFNRVLSTAEIFNEMQLVTN